MPTLDNSSSIADESILALVQFFQKNGGLGIGNLVEVHVATSTRRRATDVVRVFAMRTHHQGDFNIRLTVPSRSAMESQWTPLTRIAQPEHDRIAPDVARAITDAVMQLVDGTASRTVLCGQSAYSGQVVPLRYKPKAPPQRLSVDEKLEVIGEQTRKLNAHYGALKRRLDEYQQKMDDVVAKMKRLEERERKLREKKR